MNLSKLSGAAHKFGDDINTDYIIPGKYLLEVLPLEELATHVLEGVNPDFTDELTGEDIIVGGNNFGCGSSREEAPTVIKEAGIKAVVAKSFARIFFRNAINIGLPLLQCDTEKINNGDELEIDIENGLVKNLSTCGELATDPLPPTMQKILNDGGLVNHLKKHGEFKI